MKKLVLLLAILLTIGCGRAAAQRPMVGPVIITSPDATSTPLQIKAAASQTDNVQEWLDSTGTVVAYVEPDGTLSGNISLAGAEPLEILYTNENGRVDSIANSTWDPANGMLTLAPANMRVTGDTLFTRKLSSDFNFFAAMDFGSYPNIDNSTWNSAYSRMGLTMTQGGANPNEWGLNIQTAILPTASTVSYEKAGAIIWTVTSDPSGGGIDRDAVGADIRGEIGNTTSGRAWGILAWCGIYAGADGTCNGIEVDMVNRGTDQFTMDTTTSKIGIQIVSTALATKKSTAAIAIVSDGAAQAWYRGLWSREGNFSAPTSALPSSFIELDKTAEHNNIFRVKPTGQLLVGYLKNEANTNDYDATLYGHATVREMFTVSDNRSGGAATDNKNVLVLLSDNASSKHIIGGGRYDGSVTAWPLAVYNDGTEDFIFKTEPFFQLTASYAGGTLSAAGTTALRNNAGTLEFSNNGGAWAAVGTGATPSGWTDGGANIYNTTQTDRVMIGVGTVSGDYSAANYDGSLIVNNQMYVAANGDVTDTSAAGIAFDSGTDTFVFGSSMTGAGTAKAVSFRVGNVEVGRFTLPPYAFLFGPTVASDATRIIGEFEKNQNDSTNIMVENTTSGTSARAAVIARSNSGSRDISMGVSSAGYTTAGGLAANTGFIATGSDATNGLLFQTAAGSVVFQVGGTTADVTINTSGDITANSFAGAGSSLTALNAGNVSSGTLVIARGGTNTGSQTNNGVNYYNGSSITSSSNLTYSTNVTLTSGDYLIATSGEGVGSTGFGTNTSIVFVSGGVEGYVGANKKFQIDTGATDGTCVWIGGSLQRLTLSGAAVQVSGAC